MKFDGEWTQDKVSTNFQNDKESKDIRLREWKLLFAQYPKIVGIVYFNVDRTQGATRQIL